MKKPKILFIEPGVKVTKWVPIGIVTLAGFMREKGYPVAVRDYSGKEIHEKEIVMTIKKENPKYVGVRVLTGPNIPRALKVSRIAKKLGKEVIWGGPHPTILPEQTLENPLIDAVVIGEGEYALIDLLNYLENVKVRGKKVKPLGSGIKNKKTGNITIYPPQKKVVDLEKLPIPAWDLLKNINEYFPAKTNNTFTVITSRGCPYKCAFCHNANENVKQYLGCYRIRSANSVLDEVEFVQKLIKNKIGMLDADSDYHLVNKDYVKDWCDTLKKRAPHLKWGTCGRYSTIDIEMIDMIKDANCVLINLGVETGSRRLQEFNQKIIELPKAIKIGKALKRRNIFLTNTYIFGHPTETYDEMKQTIKYIRKIPSSLNLIQIYRPIPGTPYYDLSIKEGKVLPFNKLEDWSTQGIMRDDINVSRIPSSKMFFYFYTINFFEQLKELINMQKYYLRNGFYRKFFNNIFDNRFVKKFKELLESFER